MLYAAWVYGDRCRVATVDVFSGAAFLWAEAVCWVLRRRGCPYILSLHGGNLPAFARANPTRVSQLLSSAAIVTAPSRYLLDNLAIERPTTLLPNALDLQHYEYRLRSVVRPRMAWLRSFHRIYNPQLAIRILAHVKGRFPEATLVMAGPDKGDGSLQECQRLAAELQVENAVDFPGAIPKADISKILGRADIFLNTTNIDNTPVSVLEAMACGLCVVSTNVGGLPYVLSHEQNALLVDANGDIEASLAVGRLVSSPHLAQQLSQTGRTMVEGYDWEQILPNWELLLALVSRN